MKKIHLALLVCIWAFSINAQTTLKRYKCLSEGSADNNLVEIKIASTAISSSTPTPTYKTIFDLSERGQAAVLSNRTNDQVSEILNKKFLLDQPKKGKNVDLTNRNIRITFSIGRKTNYKEKGFNAYDRIEDLKYDFEIDNSIDPMVKFIKWDKYTTEYGTLDIGTLEYNRSFSASLDITGKIAANTSLKENKKIDDNNSTESSTSFGPELSGTAKTGYSNSSKENQSIKQRYIQLTGAFGERKFNIHQQGTRETELAGNVSIDLTISLPKDEAFIASLSNLFDESNLPKPSSQVKLDINRYYIPDVNKIKNDITGDLSYEYAVRHIEKKANTFAEFDDKISFITGSKKSNQIIIKKQDLIVPIYFLKVPISNVSKELKVDGKVLQFLSYDEALEFKTWLLFSINSIPTNGDLTISNRNITFEDIKLSETTIKNNMNNIIIDVSGY
jgi:hypothetical protein